MLRKLLDMILGGGSSLVTWARAAGAFGAEMFKPIHDRWRKPRETRYYGDDPNADIDADIERGLRGSEPGQNGEES